jgi:hypothetical protein
MKKMWGQSLLNRSRGSATFFRRSTIIFDDVYDGDNVEKVGKGGCWWIKLEESDRAVIHLLNLDNSHSVLHLTRKRTQLKEY